jgi:two-component system sensor histidine kinase PilS (NtrC family)
MFDQEKPVFPHDPALYRKMRVLIFGRLGLMCLMLLAGNWWAYGARQFAIAPIPAGLLELSFATIVLTVIYLLWLRFSRTLVWQIRSQFLIDTLLITWLVAQTGDIISPYITLYIFVIGLAGFFLGKPEAYAVAVASAVCFTSLSLLTSQSLNYSLSGQVAPSHAVQILAFNAAAFLLVGLMAARLAERRKIGEDLKRSEANFADLNILHEMILASIHSGLITTDLQGKIYAFNRAAEEISGFDAREMVGQSVFSVFGDEIRHQIESCLGGVQTAEFSPSPFEAGFRHAPNNTHHNRQITVACSVSPLLGKSGGITGLIITFQDTTDFRAMEEDLRRADRLAAVGRMAAGLAHEIRNPLGSMSSALQFMAAKERSAADDPALMNVVLRESDRLNRIITDFLAYARPRSLGSLRQRSDRIDVGAAIGDCMTLLRHDPAVCEKHILTFEPPAEPVTIKADETQIKQVFWNLFQNSIQAMPDGGKLTVGVDDRSAKKVRIVVADSGCGMDAENLERMFEPFHSGVDGTGLGLSIVHGIVTGLRGRIDVKSEPGLGTKITMELPK